jgi:hypothetical protein
MTVDAILGKTVWLSLSGVIRTCLPSRVSIQRVPPWSIAAPQIFDAGRPRVRDK